VKSALQLKPKLIYCQQLDIKREQHALQIESVFVPLNSGTWDAGN